MRAFRLPPGSAAVEPPEARGLERDEVRLLVAAHRRQLRHITFAELPGLLASGDLVVVNTSDTEPAAVDGYRAGGRQVVVHVSGPAPRRGLGAEHLRRAYVREAYACEEYLIELRTPDAQRVPDAETGELIRLPGGATAVLAAAYPDPAVRKGSRLWRARIPVEGAVRSWLAAVGHPIHYSYLRSDPPLSAFRTIFATPSAEFGSAEMPSAGRPFTQTVLDGLRARGVGLAEVTLHTGVSSLETDEMPLPERFRVPAATADMVNATRAAGGRVIAAGTTVTRALETVAGVDGTVRPGAGWTDLVLGPERPARVVNGLVTGWHEPGASHLLLLEAVAGTRLVERAYEAAIERGYLWHEFGDSCLLLPRSRT